MSLLPGIYVNRDEMCILLDVSLCIFTAGVTGEQEQVKALINRAGTINHCVSHWVCTCAVS